MAMSAIVVLQGCDDVTCLAGHDELTDLAQRLLEAALPTHDPDCPLDSTMLMISSSVSTCWPKLELCTCLQEHA